MSVERFAQGRDCYLAELAAALRDGSYRPQPVRRVYIPKGKGQRPPSTPSGPTRFPRAAIGGEANGESPQSTQIGWGLDVSADATVIARGKALSR